MTLLALWQDFRGAALRVPVRGPEGVTSLPMGRMPGRLPFSGSLLDQPACVLAAFEIMSAADDELQLALGNPA